MPHSAAIAAILTAAILLTGCSTAAAEPLAQGPKPSSPTMQVIGRHIYTAAGEKVILRGFNEMFGFSKNPRGIGVMEEIAKTGANSVRIVTTVNSGAEDVDAAIANAVSNGLIPIVECHSATGKWERLGLCVDYWLRPEINAVLGRHQRWVLLNIANEAGAEVSRQDFVAGYSDAIRRIRAAGIQVPLIIDGTDWGKEYQMLLDEWDTLDAVDPQHKIIMSAHTYWVGTDEERKDHYRRIIRRVTGENIPFIIGEGPTAAGYDCTPSPYGWAMDELNEAEIGWLTWSWGMIPNGDCKENAAFDITRDGIFGQWKSEAGRMIAVAHPASVANTSRRPCSIPNAGPRCVRPASAAARRD